MTSPLTHENNPNREPVDYAGRCHVDGLASYPDRPTYRARVVGCGPIQWERIFKKYVEKTASEGHRGNNCFRMARQLHDHRCPIEVARQYSERFRASTRRDRGKSFSYNDAYRAVRNAYEYRQREPWGDGWEEVDDGARIDMEPYNTAARRARNGLDHRRAERGELFPERRRVLKSLAGRLKFWIEDRHGEGVFSNALVSRSIADQMRSHYPHLTWGLDRDEGLPFTILEVLVYTTPVLRSGMGADRMSLAERAEKLIDFYGEDGFVSVRRIMTVHGRKQSASEKLSKRLRDEGYLEKIPSGEKNGRRGRYRWTQKAIQDVHLRRAALKEEEPELEQTRADEANILSPRWSHPPRYGEKTRPIVDEPVDLPRFDGRSRDPPASMWSKRRIQRVYELTNGEFRRVLRPVGLLVGGKWPIPLYSTYDVRAYLRENREAHVKSTARSEAAKARWDALSPEERGRRAAKAQETRRRNAERRRLEEEEERRKHLPIPGGFTHMWEY